LVRGRSKDLGIPTKTLGSVCWGQWSLVYIGTKVLYIGDGVGVGRGGGMGVSVILSSMDNLIFTDSVFDHRGNSLFKISNEKIL